MEALTKKLRKDILNASFEAGACHLGSALSCLDIMIELFYKILKPEDVFIFSKASGAATYYSILSDKGYFPHGMISVYLKQYPLVSKEVPGVIHSVGSIGHGLNVACGIALANRSKKVYVLISDGEIDEGSTYEAALFARQHKLDNLYVICDNNGLQACGATKGILDLDTAHEFLQKTLPNYEKVDTIKGQGVSFMENDYRWHYKNLTGEELEQALKENE